MSEGKSLSRSVGLVALTLYGVGDILGAGVYGLIGKAAGQMGNAVWLAFLMSMIAAGLTGLSYAAVGSRFPKAAGASYVTQKAFQKTWLSYFVGLAAMASGMMSMATASRIFSSYLNAVVDFLSVEVLIVCFASVLASIVFKGIKESMWVNSLCTVIEVTGLLVIVVFGLSSVGNVNYLDATTTVNLQGEISFSLILSGAVLTFYSFIGFEDMLNVGEEVKEPEKTLPRALIFAVVGSSIIYILISLISVAAVPAPDLAASKEPLVDVVRQVAPFVPPKLYTFIALFAVSNTALLNFIMGSRLLYGMSKQNLLPKFLSQVHAKTATPHKAILVMYLILLGLALSGDISSLAKATSVLLLTCFIVVNLSLIRLKIKEKRENSSQRTKKYFDVPIFVPLLGAIVCLTMLFFAQKAELILALICTAVIFALYFVMKPKAIEED